MVLSPVNNSYSHGTQNPPGFNPNKLIGGNAKHQQNAQAGHPGGLYQTPHGGATGPQNPKSHRGELYQGSRPFSHGETVHGLNRPQQMQSHGNSSTRQHHQVQHSADLKSQRQWTL